MRGVSHKQTKANCDGGGEGRGGGWVSQKQKQINGS